jgi:pimeloyl-ACP methyl ester carboxylesterase
MSSISFNVQGEGKPVILIHGFPFNKRIWTRFAEDLSKNFKIFSIDLPGFGDSPLLREQFDLAEIADSVLTWMQEEKIEKPVVVGHSLGGYITLEMAKKSPDLFSSFVLFHSTGTADSQEKKESRNKVLDFIKNNGVQAFTSNFIEPLFAKKSNDSIATVRTIAMEANEKTVIAYTKAMRDRSDSQGVLQNFPRPILIITGEKDPGIPVESITKQASLSPRVRLEILREAAHMGMFEEKTNTLDLIKNFIASSNQPYV